MPNRRPDRGKGKAVVIDLTIDEPTSSTSDDAGPTQPVPPATPHRNTRLASSVNGSTFTHAVPSTPARAGPSNTAIPYPITPTPGSKRTASQARITSFFPTKKPRVDPIPFQLTKEEKKAERDAQKLAEEEDRVARADAKRLVKEIEREEKAQKKAEKERLKQEAREAKAARQRDRARWKADWTSWVRRYRQPHATFPKPRNTYSKSYVNITGAGDFGLTREERECLPHCDLRNPHQTSGEDYYPMKLYRTADVELLAWRKEGVLAGVSQDDEEALLKEGKRLYKARKGGEQDDKVE